MQKAREAMPRELPEETKLRQQQALGERIRGFDVVITTASSPDYRRRC